MVDSSEISNGGEGERDIGRGTCEGVRGGITVSLRVETSSR
jgi:hypothetical protein